MIKNASLLTKKPSTTTILELGAWFSSIGLTTTSSRSMSLMSTTINSTTSKSIIGTIRTTSICKKNYSLTTKCKNQNNNNIIKDGSAGTGTSPIPPKITKVSLLTKIRTWWDNGTILLYIGYTGLSLIAIDRFIVYQQGKRMRQQSIQMIQNEIQNLRTEIYNKYWDKPAIYKAKIISTSLYEKKKQKQLRDIDKRKQQKVDDDDNEVDYTTNKYGGSHMLQHTSIYDIVDVLEENVGPSQSYHLCRLMVSPNNNSSSSSTNDNNNNDNNNEKQEEEVPKIAKSIGWFPKRYLEKVN